jgi:hypothetical protein
LGGDLDVGNGRNARRVASLLTTTRLSTFRAPNPGSPLRMHSYTTDRAPGWLQHGSGTFHDTVVNLPMVAVFSVGAQDRNVVTSTTARSAS